MSIFLPIPNSVREFSCATIDTARSLLLDELDAVNERLAEASYKAALAPGNDGPVVEAESERQLILQKLEGLKHGRALAEREENKRAAAETLVKRRAAAVEILSLMRQRSSSAAAIDAALQAVDDAIEKVEHLGEQLGMAVTHWFWDGDKGQSKLEMFLLDVGLFGMTDVAANARKDVGEIRSYSRGLPFNRATALRTLAEVIPEINDPLVQEEAQADARLAILGGDNA